MPGRKYSNASGYRYGFNGKELDTDDLIQYDYGFRIYDPRLGRFKSVDPLYQQYPGLTPYQFTSNSPIANVDLDGREAAYYTITIQNVYIHTCTGAGESIKFEQKIVRQGMGIGLFGKHGPLGTGEQYSISVQPVDIYESFETDFASTKKSAIVYGPSFLLKTIYKLSEDDIMKSDISKRPMFSGKYQLLVFGSGSDNSESPGEQMNPNAVTESINMEAWNDFFEPILMVMDAKSPIKSLYDPPSLEDIVGNHIGETIKRTEKLSNKDREPNSTICSQCTLGPHPQDGIDAYRRNKYGDVTDTIRKNQSTGKIDTIPTQNNSTKAKHN